MNIYQEYCLVRILKKTHINELAFLSIVYREKASFFENFLETDRYVPIHI